MATLNTLQMAKLSPSGSQLSHSNPACSSIDLTGVAGQTTASSRSIANHGQSMISLPDWAFYPLASLIAGGMIAGALSFGDVTHRAPEEIRAEGLAYEGDSLNAITTGNGLTAELLTEGDTTFLRVSAVRGPLDGIQSAGAFFTLSPDELSALEGHRVRFTFRVRQAAPAPADGVRFNFFVPNVGQDSWQRHTVSDEYGEIIFDLSPQSCDWAHGYIGIWPDWDNDRNAVDIARVTLTALEPLEC